jgi:lipopolysaccharide transport system ATP-binding protein
VIKSGIPDDVIADYLYIVQKDRVAASGLDVSLTRHEKGFSATGYDVVNAEFLGLGQHATLAYGSNLVLNIDIQKTLVVDAPFLILDVIDNRGMQLSGRRIAIPDFTGVRRLTVTLHCTFQKGIYRIRMRLVSAPSIELTMMMSRYDELLSVEMIDDVRDKFTGLFPLPIAVNWEEQ